ncbi:MAG: putative zinc-binding protein [Candidatus Goldbacteria bacterium]|nr:putative zinc-binding protein [Candidatus Goldiibacteriota bacterium]
MSGCCGGAEKNIICACSGAADVGFISDRTARMLSVAGHGGMYCLAGAGADIESFVKGAKEADRVIVIDGCPVKCSQKIMDRHGVKSESYVVTSFGFEKGETGMSDDTVKEAFMKIQKAVNNNTPGNSASIDKKGSCGCGGSCC